MKRLVAAGTVLVLVACGPAPDVSSTIDSTPDLATTPSEVGEQLLDALRRGEPRLAADLTDPSQFPLLALVEGMSAREVAQLGPVGLQRVAENFWSEFLVRFPEFVDADLDEFRIGTVTQRQGGASRFAEVEVVLGRDASVRRFFVRDTPGGWFLDLVVTFPSPLLERLPEVAAAVRQSGDEALNQGLVDLEDSIRFVFDDASISSEMHQAATAALEAVDR